MTGRPAFHTGVPSRRRPAASTRPVAVGFGYVRVQARAAEEAKERRIAAVHELGPFLDGRGPTARAQRVHAAAGARARLEHDDVGAARGETAGGGETGDAGADDDHVVHQPKRSTTGKSASSEATASEGAAACVRPVTTSRSGPRRSSGKVTRASIACVPAAPRS